MVSIEYAVYRVLEDHVSVGAAHVVHKWLDRWFARPRRYLRSAFLWCTRAEDRKYLSRPWHPRPWVAAYLAGRFGYTEWDVCRGGIDNQIVGFIPITRDAEGKKLFHTSKLVFDMRAMRGYAALDLKRLEMRG